MGKDCTLLMARDRAMIEEYLADVFREETRRTGEIRYYSMACMHCDNAPCVTACPSGCLYKDPETGLTLYNTQYCIGCHSCAMACPFGAPTFGPDGKMRKCDGCIDRLRACLLYTSSRAISTAVLPPKAERGWLQSMTMGFSGQRCR